MSSLKVGLVTSCSTESDLLVKLLVSEGVELIYNISPSEILTSHAEAENLHVWLLNVDDASWHDAVDHLLDESEVPVYFSEPGLLTKQKHPEFWCKNLVDRLFEITGLTKEPDAIGKPESLLNKETNEVGVVLETDNINNQEKPLSNSLDELEISTVGLPSDIAAELVIELESLSPVLSQEKDLENSELTCDVNPSEVAQQSIDEKIVTQDIELSESGLDSIDLEASDLDSYELDEIEIESLPEANFDEEPEIELIDFDLDENSSEQAQELNFDANEELQSIENLANDNSQLSIESDLIESDELKSDNNLDEVQTELSFEADSLDFDLDLNDEVELDLQDSQDTDLEDDEFKSRDLELEVKDEDANRAKNNKEKARFEIDETELLSEEVEVAKGNVAEDVSADVAPDKLSELSLVAIEEENKKQPADWLNVKPDNESQALNLDESNNSSSVEPFLDLDDELELIEPKIDLPVEEPLEETNSAIDLSFDGVSQLLDESLAINEEELTSDFELEEINQINDTNLPSDDALDNNSICLDNASNQQEEQVVPQSSNNFQAQTLETSEQSIEEFDIPMLDETASEIDFEEKEPSLAPVNKLTPCWVIGASLGGPAAVKRFMQCIPKDINASFVVAQHIDESFLSVLAEILTNNSPFDVTVAKGSHDMSAGKIVIAPLKGKIDFLTDGSLLVDHSQKWSAPYAPCVDDVIKSVSQAYGKLSGAIIFSGMGEDGLNGAKKMRERGGVVWAQSPQTCANSSMPEAVINENLADFVGSPEELAEKLVAYLSE